MTRAALLLWTVLGTGGWALSFATVGTDHAIFRVACGIETAAVVAWSVLVTVLWVRSRTRGELVEWVDLCLRTMSIGSIPLASAGAGMALLELVPPPSVLELWPAMLAVHAGALLVSDVVMTTIFVRGGRRLATSTRAMLGLWGGALHGVFAVTFVVLAVLWGYDAWLIGRPPL